jgi:hypothetical protein
MHACLPALALLLLLLAAHVCVCPCLYCACILDLQVRTDEINYFGPFFPVVFTADPSNSKLLPCSVHTNDVQFQEYFTAFMALGNPQGTATELFNMFIGSNNLKGS